MIAAPQLLPAKGCTADDARSIRILIDSAIRESRAEVHELEEIIATQIKEAVCRIEGVTLEGVVEQVYQPVGAPMSDREFAAMAHVMERAQRRAEKILGNVLRREQVLDLIGETGASAETPQTAVSVR